MKEERLKKEKQDMLGFYDYTVVLTYISLAVSVFGMTRALEGDFKVAILCLALSGLCDMFDGKIARTKKNRTEDEKKFGIQIDSLCDVVCFGVFPAMICYCLGMNHIPGVIILCLYCVASVIRLGYFNVMEEKRQNETSELRHYYQGLPITSMAIILPFLYLLRRGCGKNFLLVIHVAVVVVGAMMVGKITNLKPGACEVKKGEEKGYFEFGGSTIVLLLQHGKVRLDSDLIENSENGYETIVRMGERIGKCKLPKRA